MNRAEQNRIELNWIELEDVRIHVNATNEESRAAKMKIYHSSNIYLYTGANFFTICMADEHDDSSWGNVWNTCIDNEVPGTVPTSTHRHRALIMGMPGSIHYDNNFFKFYTGICLLQRNIVVLITQKFVFVLTKFG